MNFLEELKAGKGAIYGQWAGWISAVLLLILGLTRLFSMPIFAIIALAQGAFLFLLEFPFFAGLLRGTDRIIEIGKDLRLKCGIYTVFALLMWFSLVDRPDAILICAILETFAALLYGYALFKGESASGSNLVSSQGIAQAALNRV